MIKRVLSYPKEVKEELAKVTWPTREQTIQKTSLVIIVSVLVGIYIGGLDALFAFIMKFITR